MPPPHLGLLVSRLPSRDCRWAHDPFGRFSAIFFSVNLFQPLEVFIDRHYTHLLTCPVFSRPRRACSTKSAHDSAPESSSPRNLCVLSVSALDSSSGFSFSHPQHSLSLFFSNSSALFCAFLHFLAPPKNSTLFFSTKSELFHENIRGWGTPTLQMFDKLQRHHFSNG